MDLPTGGLRFHTVRRSTQVAIDPHCNSCSERIPHDVNPDFSILPKHDRRAQRTRRREGRAVVQSTNGCEGKHVRADGQWRKVPRNLRSASQCENQKNEHTC